MIVVSVGCPAGVGPEVSVRAAASIDGRARVLVGDPTTIQKAARLVRIDARRLLPFTSGSLDPKRIYVKAAGPTLTERDLDPERVTRAAGVAQLAYIEAAYALVKAHPGSALVTGPVSKAAVAHSGLKRARAFRGHTEWLQALDGARSSVMCFADDQLVTSLATTHLPLAKVSRRLTKAAVSEATVQLAALLHRLGHDKPRLFVCSLNPHAGESELFGAEEETAILPGIRQARRSLRGRAEVEGPIGAETAYRKAYAAYREAKQQASVGVVAMYHDQATIPMKLIAFGTAVNVTMGLSIVRTSVDHGTGYDIAWQGRADATGMLNAMKLGLRLVAKPAS